MSHIRCHFSMLCIAGALALALVKPLPSQADEGAAPAQPTPTPTSTSTEPILQPLPLVPPKLTWTPPIHIPFGKRVVGFAKHFVGTRYVYGGSSPRSGFDCSGFVRFVYAHFGVSLPHSSYAQFDRGRHVSRRGLRPGDLVFFDGLGHVGMYIGNGRFIHAPHTGTHVQIQTLAGWYGSRFDGARRLRAA